MHLRRWHATALLGATAIVASVALAGCSGGSDSGAPASRADPMGEAPAKAPAGGAAERGPAEQGGAGPAAQAPDLRVDQRAIIYTGSITVRVPDVYVAAAKAISFATAAGGFVGSDKRSSTTGSADATIELRVPAGKFQTVVDQLAGQLDGKEESREINTEDVTEETIDLDARIASQQSRVDSGRRLLSQAKSLGDLVMLERELATREADLASLNGKKRRLGDLAALATVTVVLLDREAVLPDSGSDDPAGFLSGLKGGWNALLASLAVLLTILGALLPWFIALGVPAWGIYWLVKRLGHRSPRAAHTPAYATTGPPLPAHPSPAPTTPPTPH